MNLETFTPAPLRAGSCVTDASSAPVPTCAPRILVADDDELIREIVRATLVNDGFDVKAAADGEQAWEVLHREHFDLLVTDNEMPRLTGLNLIERICNEGLSLPVIMASGTFPVDQARNDAQPQIAALLPKPFALLDLLDTVRHALHSAGESTGRARDFPRTPSSQPATDPLSQSTAFNIMRTLTLSTERCRKFKPLVRLRRADRRPNGGKLERVDLTRRAWDEGEIVASFGDADRIHDEGRWELCGGSPADHAAAREWSSHYQQEATLPSEPLPLTVLQQKATKAIHNRILIVDDDFIVRGSLAAVLESEGFAVDEAHNGIEAVTRAIERVPDLVLLDLNMPHWDGWTAFTQLDRVRPLLPVIVITARPNQYKEAVRLGVDAFMEKPLNIPLLVRAIKRLTSEEESRHVRRITSPAFVTQLLGSTDS